MKHNKKALILRITCILLFSLALSPLQVANASSDQTVELWDVERQVAVATLSGHTATVWSVTFSSDSKLLASAGYDETIKLWDVERRAEIAVLKGSHGAIYSVAFSSDDRLLVSGGQYQRLTLWDVERRQEIVSLRKHKSSVLSVAISPNDQLIASASSDQTVELWDVERQVAVATLSGHTATVWSVTFSPDSKLLASGSGDQTVKLWDVEQRGALMTLNGHSASVNSVAFSSDGRLLASGSRDSTIRIWDIEQRQELAVLRGHKGSVNSVAFSPDDQLIASGSSDRTVKLWDVALHTEVATLNGHTGTVWSIVFSPDSKLLASASSDSTVKLWRVGTSISPPKPKYNPNLEVTVSFSEPSGNNILEEGEAASIYFVVHNTGRGEAYNLKPALMFSESQLHDGIFLKETKQLSRLDPGDSSILVAMILTDTQITDQIHEIRVHVVEANGFDSDPVVLRFQTRATRLPKLEIAEWAIDDDSQGESQGNGNRQFELGEIAEVTLRITNSGEGSTKDAKLRLSLPRDPNVFYQSASSVFELGDLPPRASKDITFAISTNKRFSGDSIELLVQFIDARSRLNSESYFQLPMKQMSAPLAAPINIVPITVLPATVEVLPALTSLVDTDIPTTGMRNPDAVAVVIGNYQYVARDIPPVPYAQGDAAIMKEYLVKALGYDEGNILYVENATKARMEALFGTDTDFKGRVYSYIKSGKSDLFVYYSGHGAPDIASGKSYFVPSDCDPTLVRLGGYSLETFYKNLSQLATKKTWVVIDACFSGASQEGTLIKGASPIYIELEGSEKLLKNGTVFSSAKGEQVASWYPEKKHGLFTYFFLKGLQGSADSDGDEVITTSEMESYITDNVSGVPYMARRLWQREQLPIVTADDKNEVLLDLK